MYTNRFSKATRLERHETCRPIPEGTRESEGREEGKRQLRLRLVIGRLCRILRSTFALRATVDILRRPKDSLGGPDFTQMEPPSALVRTHRSVPDRRIVSLLNHSHCH